MRPHKEGLDYFSFDVDFFEHKKVKMVRAKHGDSGVLSLVMLLSRVYSGKGYFYEWGECEQLVFASDIGKPLETVQAIVSDAARWGFFDSHLLDEFEILTSTGIQERFFEATEKRKHRKVDPRLLLITLDPSTYHLSYFRNNPGKFGNNPPRSYVVNSELTRVNSPETADFTDERPEFSPENSHYGVISELTPVISELTPRKSEISTQSKVKERREEREINKLIPPPVSSPSGSSSGDPPPFFSSPLNDLVDQESQPEATRDPPPSCAAPPPGPPPRRGRPPKPASVPAVPAGFHPSPAAPPWLNRKLEELRSRPDPSDPPSDIAGVWLTDTEWESLMTAFGPDETCCLIAELERWSTENESGFKKKKDHNRTIRGWRNRALDGGKKSFAVLPPPDGPGYYLRYVVDQFNNQQKNPNGALHR
jgi:hypothetical protein